MRGNRRSRVATALPGSRGPAGASPPRRSHAVGCQDEPSHCGHLGRRRCRRARRRGGRPGLAAAAGPGRAGPRPASRGRDVRLGVVGPRPGPGRYVVLGRLPRAGRRVVHQGHPGAGRRAREGHGRLGQPLRRRGQGHPRRPLVAGRRRDVGLLRARLAQAHQQPVGRRRRRSHVPVAPEGAQRPGPDRRPHLGPAWRGPGPERQAVAGDRHRLRRADRPGAGDTGRGRRAREGRRRAGRVTDRQAGGGQAGRVARTDPGHHLPRGRLRRPPRRAGAAGRRHLPPPRAAARAHPHVRPTAAGLVRPGHRRDGQPEQGALRRRRPRGALRHPGPVRRAARWHRRGRGDRGGHRPGHDAVRAAGEGRQGPDPRARPRGADGGREGAGRQRRHPLGAGRGRRQDR